MAAGRHAGSHMTYDNYDSAKNYTIDSANSAYNLAAHYATKAKEYVSN
jgi:hypothetical protein